MYYECHHLDKFISANSDLIEESLETNRKAVVLMAGASSSGKSYASQALLSSLNKKGHKAIIISLDQYDFGLSGIIPNKVNLNTFNNSLTDIEEIRERIKDVIYYVPFDRKYSPDVISKLRLSLCDLLPKGDLERFLKALVDEWNKLNFDECTVYDLFSAASDIRSLLSNNKIREKKYSKVYSEQLPSDNIIDGKDIDVIIVEGIYALDPSFLDQLVGIDLIKVFIEGDAKTLFLRRIIRDSLETSADNAFTIAMYFKNIVKSYKEQIEPNKKNADIIFHNDMAFTEMTSGNLYLSKLEFKDIKRENLDKLLNVITVDDKRYQMDYYLSSRDESVESKNVLRLRSISNSGENGSYKIASLVHKGIPKLRKDRKNIRPINVLLDESEIDRVWKDIPSAILDFEYADFKVNFIRNQIKIRAHYRDQKITIRDIKDRGIKIELSIPYDQKAIEEIKDILKVK